MAEQTALPGLTQKLTAEVIGTFVLVFFGCGSITYAGTAEAFSTTTTIGLTFGLAVMVMVYAFGRVSGAHFNPAVSVGLWAGGRFPTRDLVPYIIAQVAGGLLAGFILLQIASGATGFAIDGSQAGAFARNAVVPNASGKATSRLPP